MLQLQRVLRASKHSIPLRAFSTIDEDTIRKISRNIRAEFGQDDGQDDFLPDEQDAINEQRFDSAAGVTISQKPDDFLRHNTEFNGTLFKYDLPVENAPIVFKGGDLVTMDEAEPLTATENLFD